VTWLSLVRAFIRDKWDVGDQFRIDDLYAELEMFERAYPHNHHVRDKLRQVMQYLRDDGEILFVDDAGLYKRLR
jgi:hypothetical protein